MKRHTEGLDPDTAAVLRLTRRIPPFWKSHEIAKMILKRYMRQPREPFETDVLGYRMRLDPRDFVQRAVLFYPQLFDYHEIRLIKQLLKPGDIFLDIGANVGFYAFMASDAVGAAGKVYAVEADPSLCATLQQNIDLNGVRNIVAINAGVSDRRETLQLGLNTSGNRGANSFLPHRNYEGEIDVECYALTDLLKAHSVERFAGAKLDIEGFEYRVLDQYFKDADRTSYPNFLLIENNRKYYREEGMKAVDLLREQGYELYWSSRVNLLFTLKK